MSPAELVSFDSPSSWAILLVAVLGLGLAPLLAIAAAFRLRVPAVLWWALPLLVASLGVAGCVYGQVQASRAMVFADPELQGVLAASGHALAYQSRLLGHGTASGLLFLSAVLAALPLALRPGEQARFHLGTTLGGVALTGLAALAVAISSLAWHLGVPGFLYAAGLLLCGLPAVAAGSLRSGIELIDRRRLAEGRLVVAVCLVGAVLLGGQALLELATVQEVQGAVIAAPELADVLAESSAAVRTGARVCLGVGAGLGGLAALLTLALSGRDLDGRSVVSLVLGGLGLLVWLALLAGSATVAQDYLDLIG